MSRKDISHLDAELLAARMKRHRSRSVKPVAARSNMQYLRKHAIADVWIPTEPAQRPRQEPVHAQMSVSSAKIREAEKPMQVAAVRKPAAANRIDFAQNAAQWKAAKKARRSIAKSSKLRSPRLMNFALVGMAGFLFLLGVAAALHSFRVDRHITSTVLAQSQENGATTTDAPVDEKVPSSEDVQAYSVAPDMPRLISIPALGVLSRVQQVGMDENGALGAPYNIHDVAWYSDSVKPGSPGGASIIDGHVSGPTQKGVFQKLDQLKSGDDIEIEKGDGTKVAYKVVRVETVDVQKVDMAKLLLPVTVGKHGLNLISCAGKFNAATNSYEQRVLVFAEAV